MKIVEFAENAENPEFVMVVPTPDSRRPLTLSFYDSLKSSSILMPHVIFVESSGPTFNFSQSVNTGIKRGLELNPKYIAIANDDLRFPFGWDKQLISLLERHPEIDYIIPQFVDEYGSPAESVLYMHHWFTVQLISRFYLMFPRLSADGRKMIELIDHKLNAPKFNNHFHVLNLNDRFEPKKGFFICPQPLSIMRVTLLSLIGLFDENFMMIGCEDFDFAIRVYLAGRKAAISEGVKVVHFGATTAGGTSLLTASNSQTRYRMANNWLRLTKKFGMKRFEGFRSSCITASKFLEPLKP